MEIFSVNWDVAIQQNIPPEKLARVFSFDVAGSFAARPIGLAMTGPIAQMVGFHAWLWVVAGVIVGTLLLVLLVPSVRHLQRLADGPNDPVAVAPGD